MARKDPVVAIIGRRNVGKSTLFNSLIREKVAIVDDHPGLTRDVISYRMEYEQFSFTLTDTPGLDLPDQEELSMQILKSAQAALDRCDVIIMLLEYPSLQPFDHDLLDIVRKTGKPVVIAVNKMDNPEDYERMTNFYELGVSDLIPISALRRTNIEMMLDTVTAYFPPGGGGKRTVDMKIALVGKPNAGKSTLINAYLGFERSVVSEIPGTTRDAVNECFPFYGKTIEIIDTAGLRKRSRVSDKIEYFSLTRSIRSIAACDVVIHLIDAAQGITDTDKKIADEIVKANKPLIIAVNKWDTMEKDTHTFNEYVKDLQIRFYRTGDFPVISISAKEKTRIHKLMLRACELFEQSRQHMDTGQLNREIERIIRSGRLPGLGSDIKVFYATQLRQSPPAFKLFVNDASKFRRDTIRFFQKEFQKLLGIKGIPVRIIIEGKQKKTAGRRR